LKNHNFIVQADGTLVIKHTPKNVTVFHNSDHFLDVIKRHLQKYVLEVFLIVVKIEAETEFRLEVCPDAVVFGTFWFQQNVLHYFIIEYS